MDRVGLIYAALGTSDGPRPGSGSEGFFMVITAERTEVPSNLDANAARRPETAFVILEPSLASMGNDLESGGLE